jgi:hypothetical protein
MWDGMGDLIFCFIFKLFVKEMKVELEYYRLKSVDKLYKPFFSPKFNSYEMG